MRNSGVTAVVEGVGDHGCEYMTGGKIIVLGKTGRNFAAGMSGGIAYIYDPFKRFVNGLCNTETIEYESVKGNDEKDLKRAIELHLEYTDSNLASDILDNWKNNKNHFVKVMPIEYKRALIRLKKEKELTEELIN